MPTLGIACPELGYLNTPGFYNSPALELTGVSSQACHSYCLSLRYKCSSSLKTNHLKGDQNQYNLIASKLNR